MGTNNSNGQPVMDIWAPPNVEGKDPHAAFSMFLIHVKKILRPAELGYLLRPLMQPLANKEMSIIDQRDALREMCGAERTIVQDRLSAMANAVEVYAKANRTNPFLFERLGWMIYGVTNWDPQILGHGDITFTNEEHLEELSEGFRRHERYLEAGIGADEEAMEGAFADGFVNAVFRTDELRAEVVERLKGIAAKVTVAPTNGTTATQGTTEQHVAPVQWNGTTQELAYLFDLLVKEGWIERGRNRTVLARQVAMLFKRSNGEPMDFNSLRTYLSRNYQINPREGVDFTATKNPGPPQ